LAEEAEYLAGVIKVSICTSFWIEHNLNCSYFYF
jgi:hypothetical protein